MDIVLSEQMPERLFRLNSNLDRRSPPWRENWNRVAFQQFKTIGRNHRFSREDHHTPLLVF